jgi:hypothetical protein
MIAPMMVVTASMASDESMASLIVSMASRIVSMASCIVLMASCIAVGIDGKPYSSQAVSPLVSMASRMEVVSMASGIAVCRIGAVSEP